VNDSSGPIAAVGQMTASGNSRRRVSNVKHKKESDIITAAEETCGLPWTELFALNGSVIGSERAGGQVILHMIDDDHLADAALRLLRQQGKTRNDGDA